MNQLMGKGLFYDVKNFCRRLFLWAIYLFIFIGGQCYRVGKWAHRKWVHRRWVYKKEIIEHLREENDPEKAEILEFIADNGIQIIPYFFTLDYSPGNITVYRSADCGAKYVLHRGKKIFFKKSWSNKKIKASANALFMEQDRRSPHTYDQYKDCVPARGDIIADIGAAEGIWALSYVDIAQKVYLFECDAEWIEALELTFAPWKDKVEIIPKCVDRGNSVGSVSLDSFFNDKPVDCIKADIEGAEEQMLKGGARVFRDKISKAIICVYHKYEDELEFKEYLRDYKFSTLHLTDGFMIISQEGFASENTPWNIRRGVLCARK